MCTKLYSINVVDCEWDEWTTGECDKTCGGGLLIKERTVLVDEANGGNPCAGSSSVTESCNIDPCPGNDGLLNLIFIMLYSKVSNYNSIVNSVLS